MRQDTLKQLSEALRDLADVFCVKQPSERALKIWQSALSGIEDRAVMNAVNCWADHNRKFPTPAELRKNALAEEACIRDREAEIDRAEKQNFVPITRNTGKLTRHFRRALKRCRAYQKLQAASKDGQWLWNLINAYADGAKLEPIQIRHIEKALGHEISEHDLATARQHVERLPFKPFASFLREEVEKSGETLTPAEEAILSQNTTIDQKFSRFIPVEV